MAPQERPEVRRANSLDLPLLHRTGGLRFAGDAVLTPPDPFALADLLEQILSARGRRAEIAARPRRRPPSACFCVDSVV